MFGSVRGRDGKLRVRLSIISVSCPGRREGGETSVSLTTCHIQSDTALGMSLSLVNTGIHFIKKGVLQPSYEEFYQHARHRFDLRWEEPSETISAVRPEELVLSKHISLGQFGNGSLMQHRKGKNYFLMKTLNKQKIISEGKLESLKAEKKLLLSCNFPLIWKLIQCISDRTSVHLLYEWSHNDQDYFRQRTKPDLKLKLFSQFKL